MGAEQSTPVAPLEAAGNAAAAGPASADAATPAATAGPVAASEGAATTPSALVIVGPSGVGKGTLIKRLMEGNDQFGFSVSHTTRAPRPNEQHGAHYFFTTKEQFAKDIGEGKFLEYAEVHGNLYGTSLQAVRSVLDSGRVCILDIDVQGARAVRKSSLQAIFVFIAPPSLEDLAFRLAERGTETVEQITRRMHNARDEIMSLNEPNLYDYLVINDNLAEATSKLQGIAARAAAGLAAEPGKVPQRIILQQDDENEPMQWLKHLRVKPKPEAAAAVAGTATDTPAGDEAAAPAATVTTPPGESAASTSVAGLAPTEAQAAPQAQPEAAGAAAEPTASSSGAASAAPPASAPALPPVASAAAAAASAAAPSAPMVLEGVPPGFEKWQGKVALVTGASSGIGWATCEALALAGMRVVAVARRKERLEELQRQMHSLGVPPVNFLPVVCDITKDAEVATLPKIVAKRWPELGIDVLVNNAGLSRNDASLFDGNIAAWVEMLSTNVLGTCMVTRAVLQDMRRRNTYGHIINMVGLSGHRIPDGPQGGGFYSATKAAVKAITEGLRQEARGAKLPLRVSGISPGMVETEFFAVRSYGDMETAKRATSQFKCLQPVDVADAIMWCLSCPEGMEVNDIVVRPVEQLI